MVAYVIWIVAVLEVLEGLEELEGPELLIKDEGPGDLLVWPLFLFSD